METYSGEADGVPAVSDRYLPCLAQLRAVRPSLPEAELRVADYIAANPSLVLRSSINAVAAASSSGIGTVARLCGRLGYGGFPSMKIALAVELLNPGIGATEPVHNGDNPKAVIRKVLRFGAQSLHETACLLDPGQLGLAAEALTRARRVDVYASGALTGAVGLIAQHRLLMLGAPCALYTSQTEHALAAQLLGAGDVALGLSHSGEAETVADALSVAGGAGAITIGVSSAPTSALARTAQITLLTAFRESAFQGDAATSRLGMLGVIDVLYACVLLNKHGAPESDRLAARRS